MLRCVLLGLTLMFLAPLVARAEEKADAKKLEATLVKALKAYNEGDHKKFFADYAKAMEAIANEQTFKALYSGIAMAEFGKWKEKDKDSLKLQEKESVLVGDLLVVHYQAIFEKNKKTKVSVNFVKEGKDYKVMQIQIAGWNDD